MRLRTLGGLALEVPTFERTKPLLLLCYLALEGPKERRHLAELFWLGAANPLGSLSTALSQIRQGAPGSFEADQVRVWAELETDAKEFLAALEKGELEKALGLYQGRFLDGVFLPDWGAELEEWVYRTREFLASQARKALLRVTEADASKGRFERAAKGAELAYLLSGAPEPEPEELERLYTLMLAGGSSRAAEVRKEADSFGLTLQLSASEAKEQLVNAVAADHPTPHNLPGRSTSFVGRDLELTEVSNLLAEPDCQLLTLIGAGGVGKTRLALQMAGELLKQGQFKDGVYFVALDALTAPSLIPLNLATTLGVHLQGQDEPLSQVIHWIGDKHLLLVLDNFEHLVEGATAAAELLQRCPNLKLLVTSRERLNLEEEWTFLVKGLAYPKDDVSFINAQHYEALKFFTLRSNRTQRAFSLTSDNLPEVVRICRLVDGTPLGIELAATWVRLMPVREIAQEIEKNVDFLASEMRDTPERHRSLRATFDHSWTLLSEQERQVLRRLSVFRGGFKRDAASAVVGATLPVLASLVDKSLLRVSPSGRYDRHPLLHQFMEEKLAEQQDEAKEYRDKHAQYYLALVEQAEPHFKDAGEALWFERLEEEHDNLRAALEWTEASSQAELGLRLVGPLWWLWRIYGYLSEGRERLQRALSQAGAKEHPVARAKALNGAGILAGDQGDYTSARSLLEESVAIRQALGDKLGIANCLSSLGFIAYYQGDYAPARSLYEESIAIRQGLGDNWGIAACLSSLGQIAIDQGDHASARSLLEETLLICQGLGDKMGIALCLGGFGSIAFHQGDYASAHSFHEESLLICQGLGDKMGIAYSLEGCAALRAMEGNAEQAAQLWGAAEALREAIGAPLPPSERPRYEHYVAAARPQLNEERFTAAWEKGRTETLEQAIVNITRKRGA